MDDPRANSTEPTTYLSLVQGLVAGVVTELSVAGALLLLLGSVYTDPTPWDVFPWALGTGLGVGVAWALAEAVLHRWGLGWGLATGALLAPFLVLPAGGFALTRTYHGTIDAVVRTVGGFGDLAAGDLLVYASGALAVYGPLLAVRRRRRALGPQVEAMLRGGSAWLLLLWLLPSSWEPIAAPHHATVYLLAVLGRAPLFPFTLWLGDGLARWSARRLGLEVPTRRPPTSAPRRALGLVFTALGFLLCAAPMVRRPVEPARLTLLRHFGLSTSAHRELAIELATLSAPALSPPAEIPRGLPDAVCALGPTLDPVDAEPLPRTEGLDRLRQLSEAGDLQSTYELGRLLALEDLTAWQWLPSQEARQVIESAAGRDHGGAIFLRGYIQEPRYSRPSMRLRARLTPEYERAAAKGVPGALWRLGVWAFREEDLERAHGLLRRAYDLVQKPGGDDLRQVGMTQEITIALERVLALRPEWRRPEDPLEPITLGYASGSANGAWARLGDLGEYPIRNGRVVPGVLVGSFDPSLLTGRNSGLPPVATSRSRLQADALDIKGYSGFPTEPLASIRVRVEGPGGAANVRVGLRRSTWSFHMDGRPAEGYMDVMTGPDGRVVFDHLPPGMYSIRVLDYPGPTGERVIARSFGQVDLSPLPPFQSSNPSRTRRTAADVELTIIYRKFEPRSR